METVGLHRAHEPIGFGGATVRQFLLLWTSRRPLLLLVGTAGLMALVGEPLGTSQVARLLLIWPVLVALVGPAWAFAVFNNEGPSQRLYHWSQPVGRAGQTMARIAAGAVWLVAVYALLVLLAVVFGAIDGNGEQLASLPAASWVNLFTGAIITYLAVSALTVATDYPFRWLFVILFLIPLLGTLILGSLDLEHVARTLVQPVSNPDWGLSFAITGALAPAASEIMMAAMSPRPAEAVAIPNGWWLATVLWSLLLGGLVAGLSLIHPDRFPSLRWSR
jgi:hypothetical protein